MKTHRRNLLVEIEKMRSRLKQIEVHADSPDGVIQWMHIEAMLGNANAICYESGLINGEKLGRQGESK